MWCDVCCIGYACISAPFSITVTPLERETKTYIYIQCFLTHTYKHSLTHMYVLYTKQETVGRACGKLLSDTGASNEERRRRAQGKGGACAYVHVEAQTDGVVCVCLPMRVDVDEGLPCIWFLRSGGEGRRVMQCAYVMCGVHVHVIVL